MNIKNWQKRVNLAGNVSVNKGINSNVDVVFAEDAGALLKKGEGQNLNQSIELEESITAPVSEGQKLGKAIYSNNEESISVDLIAKNSVDSLGFFNVAKMVYGKWFTLFREGK